MLYFRARLKLRLISSCFNLTFTSWTLQTSTQHGFYDIHFTFITHFFSFSPACLLIGWADLTFTLIGCPSVCLQSFGGCFLVEVVLLSLGTFAHLIRLSTRSGLSVRRSLSSFLHLSPFPPLLHLFNLLRKQCLQRPNEPGKHWEISKSDL